MGKPAVCRCCGTDGNARGQGEPVHTWMAVSPRRALPVTLCRHLPAPCLRLGPYWGPCPAGGLLALPLWLPRGPAEGPLLHWPVWSDTEPASLGTTGHVGAGTDLGAPTAGGKGSGG